MTPRIDNCPPSTNRHLKQTNPAVAAEIYLRLLQRPNTPDREREVALRKLAECEKLIVSRGSRP